MTWSTDVQVSVLCSRHIEPKQAHTILQEDFMEQAHRELSKRAMFSQTAQPFSINRVCVFALMGMGWWMKVDWRPYTPLTCR